MTDIRSRERETLRSLTTAISLLLAGTGTLAHAQDVTDADQTAADNAGVLQEIVVTAQKREERLQDVPIAVSAISADQLNARGIGDVYDLGSLAPNLQISTATANNTGMQVSIRGATQINPALFWDPTVGIYLDGVYMSKNLGSVFEIVDLERVEVLRGPQGTLYGRNTLAGAINLVTRQPSGEFGGDASVNIGNFGLRIGKASLDLPRIGIASISLAARVEKRDGTPKTLPGSSVRDLNNRDAKSARLAVNLDFTDTFQAAYRFDFTDIDQKPLHSYLLRAEPSVLPFLQPYVTRERLDHVSVDADTFERSKVQGHSLTLTWDLGDRHELKSITAYRTLDWDDSLDLDGSPLLVAHTQRLSEYDTFSQELQLVGSTGSFYYVGGLYYFEDDGFTFNPQQFFFGTMNFDSRYGFGTKAWAAYGQVDYHVNDALTLTAGLRYTREKKNIERLLGVNFAPGDPFIPLVPEGTTAEETFSATTPQLVVSYKFSPAVNGYIKYAEGFKSGGFNGEYGDVGFTPDVIENNILEVKTPFEPEKIKSYEAGLKTTLAGGTLMLNTAVFYNDLDDLQLSIFRGTGAASSVIRNAGKATTKGFELEAAWQPIDQLRLQASYGYLDGEYDEFIDAGVNVADNRAFVHAPEHSFNLMVDGQIARTPWGVLRLLADYTWTDEFYLYPYQLASSGPNYDPTKAIARDTLVDSVGVLNLRLALQNIRMGDAIGEVALWGRNVTDEKHVANAIDFGPSFGNLTAGYYLEPRVYGMEVTVRW